MTGLDDISTWLAPALKGTTPYYETPYRIKHKNDAVIIVSAVSADQLNFS